MLQEGKKAAASRSTDMYAFGILCWEIITQKKPVVLDVQKDPEGFSSFLKAIPPNTPLNIREIVISCCHVNRLERKTAMECYSILNHEHSIVQGQRFDLFFSHAWKNKPFLSHVYHLLVQGGYRIWYDQSDMGHDLEESMRKGISSSQAVLVCLNSVYLTRSNCLFELREAKKQNKPIITLLIEPNIQLKDHPVIGELELNKFLYVDIAIRQNWEQNEPSEEILPELAKELEPLFSLIRKIKI